MNETQALELHSGGELVKASESVPSVGSMLKAVIDKGITGESVKAVESLVGLYERMEAKEAERAFASAFNALQAEMPAIQAKKPVPNNDGTIRYKFAPYEDIMEQVRPVLLKHGFTVAFDSDYLEGRIISTCVLEHVKGHSKRFKFGARIGKGPPGSSEAQGDGAASTYAKRFALCQALNITIETDDDARMESLQTITKEQAASLRERVHATASHEEAFLKFAGAKTYEDIPAAKFAMLDQNLRRKEKTT